MAARSVSVVVPTRNRPDVLARCLDALARQDDPPAEIVVVDDGSADPAPTRAVADRHPDARVVRLDGRGPAAARNAGVRAATGDVVLLTDDDCIPDTGWARALSAPLLAGEADAVGGLTLPPPDGSAAMRATEVVTDYLEEHAGLLGAGNLGCTRRLLLELPFDETFPLAAGEDREWTARVRGAGRRVVREQTAIVHHAPALDLRAFWRQHVRYGKAARALMTRGTSRFEGPSFYVGLVRAGFREGSAVGLLVLLSQAATLTGYVQAGMRPPRRRR